MSASSLPRRQHPPRAVKVEATPKGICRRSFLRRALVAGTAPLILPGAVLGLNGAVAPSNRIGFAVIGVGNRARALLPSFLHFKEIQMLAISECRADRQQSAKEIIDTHYGNRDCQAHADFRELLARKDVDAVLVAAGNRWHGLASIYAARAGKDIYSEKPVTLTIREGRILADTCRRFGAVYQAGTQRRSTGSYRFAADVVRQGKIGKLRRIEMQVWEGPAIPPDQPAPVPAGWDYDTWLGQVPWKPFVPRQVNSWQYFWDTAEGIMTDMGCHYTDQMQFALERDHTGPVEFEASGEFADPAHCMSDTPVRGVARCRYADGVEGIMYQRAGFKDRYLRFVGDEGWIQVDDDTDVVTAEPRSLLERTDPAEPGWADASSHIRNLLECIRSRKPTVCHAEIAHRAMTICQAMTISLRLGRKLRWDPVAEQFDLEAANRMMWREPRAPWRI